MDKTVYADNAATTALSQSAFQAMLPYLTNEYGNPSSIYSFGRNAKHAVENAREKVASAIGALPEEIYFTSGGTEADNWAIKSAAKLNLTKGKHVISTAFEHHAVLHTLDALKEQGYESTFPESERVRTNIDAAALFSYKKRYGSSGSQEASHVLLATRLTDQLAHSSLRFSLNEDSYGLMLLPTLRQVLRYQRRFQCRNADCAPDRRHVLKAARRCLFLHTARQRPSALKPYVRPGKAYQYSLLGHSLISIMAANNEIGTILPVKEIGESARECGVFFIPMLSRLSGIFQWIIRKMTLIT